MSKAITEPILKVRDLKVHFPIKGGLLSKVIGQVKAVDGVSFDLFAGETLGVVGESGCGKSTLGRGILRLSEPTAGEINFLDGKLKDKSFEEMKAVRRDLQMIFQDPFSSLDPRMSVEKIVTEPFRLHGVGDKETQIKKAKELLSLVGLREDDLKKYPHEFSGGQRQRIGIARAIALNPKVVVADEPIAALDVSIQAQVLNLLSKLKKEFQLTYIFISHDLSVVKYFSDRVLVMYLGKVVELTTSDKIYHKPMHPYTRALMSAILHADPSKKSQHEVLTGDVPSPINPPSGCSFHPRCKYATEICKKEEPTLVEKSAEGEESQLVSCHHADEIFQKNAKQEESNKEKIH